MNALIVRADATAATGAGHLMRSLALAQAWMAGGNPCMFVSDCGSELRARITASGAAFDRAVGIQDLGADLEFLSNLAESRNPAWIALDGYHFDTAYQAQLRRKGFRLIVLDDTAHLDRYHAGVIVNQNIHAERLRYNCDPDTVALLGTRYALLRTEFLNARPRALQHRAVNVLVIMGGSDFKNATRPVIEALLRLRHSGLSIRVVVGPANPNAEALQEMARRSSSVEILIDPPDVAALMAWADLAVSGGGSTCWELAYMRVPSVLMILAATQARIAHGLHEAGAMRCAGEFENFSETRFLETFDELLESADARVAMKKAQEGLVDGRGARRVVKFLTGSLPERRDAPAHPLKSGN
jgi:UDP-2,4-diacetamido-2,4,6-trideoxy-beta-L-altropyranose hydrolase